MSKVNLFECGNQKPVHLLKSFQSYFCNIQREDRIKNSFNIGTLGTQIYNNKGIVEDIAIAFRLIRSRWYCIQEVTLNSNDVSLTDILSSRDFINAAFNAIIQSLLLNKNSLHWQNISEKTLKLIKTFALSLVPLSKLKESIVLRLKLSRQESCPFYQYFHSLLEVYYHLMVLYSICDASLENIEKHYENVLINLSLIFKPNVKDPHKPEMCKCIQFFWLVIQLIIEKVDITNTLFWNVFNKVMEKEDPLISLCLLQELASIHRFNLEFEEEGSKCERVKPNYYFLESKFKALLSQANSDVVFRSFKLIEPLVCDLWLREGKIEILEIIWDFYSKRLNVSNKLHSSITAYSFLETLDTVLFCSKDCTEDFDFFVGLLLHHLREYPKHWGKMKGRIYSRLGPNKVKDLSEIGIRRVMMLFLALATIQFEDTEKRILAFLNYLPKEKAYTVFVWNMYAALILKYVREGRSIERIAPPILCMLEEASTNPKLFHLIKDFINNNLEYIINDSSNMQLHQWLIFGPWLGRYLSSCYFADLNYSLKVVGLLLEKCSNADSWSLWEKFFKENVYITLKQLATTSNGPAVIGKIAGKLALCYNNLFSDAFLFFNSDIVPSRIVAMFLETILDSYPDSLILTPEQEDMVLQNWVKICFLALEPQLKLTQNVVKLHLFPVALRNQLKSNGDPIETFLDYLSNSFSQSSVQSNSDALRLCHSAFGNISITLSQYLSNPHNEQIVFKIYRYVSLACLNCGNLIYNRNKSVTILNQLVEILLLPTEVLMGKKILHNFILNAIKKMWPAFFEAFLNLSSVNDSYLERTLKDMVIKYLPYFPTSDSPIVNCLENPKMAEVILEKICHSYFKPPVVESDANLLKALKIVSDLANNTTSILLFRLLVNKTLYGLFEIVILHSQRSSAIGVIKHITNSRLFAETKTEFRQTVLAITENYMALNAINYFQLMICLVRFAPDDIKHILEQIKIHVGTVERLRGVGFDKTLRLHLERLENSLQSNC